MLKNLEALVVKFKGMMKEELKSIHKQSIDIEKRIKFQKENMAKNEVRA